MSQFPEVTPGGSLMLAWQVRDKDVLVVGGGEVAAGRILHALNADAKVTVVCPASGLNAEVAYRASQDQVTHVDRRFQPEDLDRADLTLICIDDPKESLRIWHECKERRVPVNVADVPEECDFYFGSVYRDGPLQVMVSTNGNGPKMANLVKRRIEDSLPANTGAAIRNVGTLRRKLRGVASSQEEGPRRMRWISRICEQWSLEDLVELDEEQMDAMLQLYPSGEIPRPENIKSSQK
ncbi:Bifunctional dehydrogenase and ferrochelatase [Ascosphaera atra]|nr:Bifunctional dehydrogenase and ferrochelatase [Ascosphaera atra]